VSKMEAPNPEKVRRYLGVITMTQTAKKVAAAQMALILKCVKKGREKDVKQALLEIMRVCNSDGFDLGKEEGYDEGYSEGKDEGYDEGYEAKEQEENEK
jgi:flagellar biosynthesis/type III secretory pathway protein FliH